MLAAELTDRRNTRAGWVAAQLSCGEVGGWQRQAPCCSAFRSFRTRQQLNPEQAVDQAIARIKQILSE